MKRNLTSLAPYFYAVNSLVRHIAKYAAQWGLQYFIFNFTQLCMWFCLLDEKKKKKKKNAMSKKRKERQPPRDIKFNSYR